MTRLGVVMTQAVVHHYRRDELLRRLANPFWFQSSGAFPKSRTPPAGDASRGGAQLARGRAEIRGQPHAKQFALPSSAISDYRAFHCAKAKAPSGDGFRRRSSDCPAALPEKPKGLWVSRRSLGSHCWPHAERPHRLVASCIRSFQTIAAVSDIREKFAQLGLDTIVSSPGELATVIKSDIVKWAKVIKDAGIKAEE